MFARGPASLGRPRTPPVGRPLRRLGRRACRKGVSDIIATILLVAITVVLAAVLYVLISGLTGSTAAAPMSLAPSVTGTGGGGHDWYVNVGLNPSASVATSAFALRVTTSSSTIPAGANPQGTKCAVGPTTPTSYNTTNCPGPTAAGWYAVLTNSSGDVVSVFANVTWSASATVSGGSYTLIVCSYSQYADSGYKLAAYGTGSASVTGSVSL
jgi:flagellin-like protein